MTEPVAIGDRVWWLTGEQAATVVGYSQKRARRGGMEPLYVLKLDHPKAQHRYSDGMVTTTLARLAPIPEPAHASVRGT